VGPVLLLVASGVANAAVFNVTKPDDTNDGSCTASTCSLRDAIVAANASPGSTVNVPAGLYTLKIPRASTGDDGTSGDLEISTSVTINGAGAGSGPGTTTINANSATSLDGAFDITYNASTTETITLSGLNVTGGVGHSAILASTSALPTLNIVGDNISGNTGESSPGPVRPCASTPAAGARR